MNAHSRNYISSRSSWMYIEQIINVTRAFRNREKNGHSVYREWITAEFIIMPAGNRNTGRPTLKDDLIKHSMDPEFTHRNQMMMMMMMMMIMVVVVVVVMMMMMMMIDAFCI
jgi:uncharacterized membrane protein YidH (DUF202 family)